MGFLLDPPIPQKIHKMQLRVRWKTLPLRDRLIDQTRLHLADGLAATSAFSFWVIGDTGFGPQPSSHPQRAVAEAIIQQGHDCRFLLHTGDVVYQMGAPEQYPANFIAPYREWLVGGDHPERLSYRNLCFRQPFLPVPGNHDYYNLPFPYGLIVAAAQPLRSWLAVPVTQNVSLRGSATGDTYARAFLDYLRDYGGNRLVEHLDTHYTTPTDTGYALTYQPGQFTRLPNRYYQFRYGAIDFFGLDSSTFNRPVGVDGCAVLMGQAHEPNVSPEVDWEQLVWLRDRLLRSHQDPTVRGRIVFLHHPPYVTEATKLHESACLSVRRHLRWVLDAVAAHLPPDSNRPLIDLTLSGHAHCFEYLRSFETGHGDRGLNWVICGGSGARLRTQHTETIIHEKVGEELIPVAESIQFVGRHGSGEQTRWPYSFLRVEVQTGDHLTLTLHPFVVEAKQDTWVTRALDPIPLSQPNLVR